MFETAVAAADPRYCLPRNLPAPPSGRTIVVGAGKAAASMALALETQWPGPLQGVVVTRYGHGAPCRRIEVIEAAHPNPDEQSLIAAQRMLELCAGLTRDDLVICLLSGGGSALLAAPPPGVSLDDKRRVTAALLASGAAISQINTVRKHLSLIKGGRLRQAAWPARFVTLAISDVPGDDPQMIASGPTVEDQTTSADALEILRAWKVATPASILAWLADPRSQSPRLRASKGDDYVLIATPAQSLQAAAAFAERHGISPILLGDSIEGEAREVGRAHAILARSIAAKQPLDAQPKVILSGGETSVTVKGAGRGGRNSEYLLALAKHLEGARGVHALAADTDGIDGVEDNAGAAIGPDILARATDRGLSAEQSLKANDAYGFFEALDALIFTGPTRTNVNDFRAILIGGPGQGAQI